LAWRNELTPDWLLHLNPSLEYRHDRTFDRNREEWRGVMRSRLRRAFMDATTFAELGSRLDLIRTSGQGTEFLLDRNAAEISAALEHAALLGNEWRAGYRLSGRAFPDSSERDHLEHGWDGRVKWALPGGHAVALETNGARRRTFEVAASSRDNYWNEEGAFEVELRTLSRWSVRSRLEGEALQYDVEDSTVFFDYQVARGHLGLRFDGDGRWTVTVGPRAEALFSRLSPGEGYQEISGAVEIQYLGSGAWWSLTPSSGWRDYDEISGAGLSRLHSSYAFYELSVFGDQAILPDLRLRATTMLRHESHTDSGQDARSFYASIEVRWTGW
jgi:hypothetical protein